MKFAPVLDPTHLYFATATIAGHRRIFTDKALAWIVLDSWRWLRDHQRLLLHAFVVMPNHVHFIFQPVSPFDVHQVVTAFSSFTAHQLLKTFEQREDRELLEYFVQQAHGHRDRKHRFWDDPYVENVYSPAILVQKVEYIHNNPLNKGWFLAEDRADYWASSACFYDRGATPAIPVDDVRLVLG
ncbi:MAG: transposase [Anaerolinea sp.]|nr:transposase [Anaerolinea sp.]